MNEKKQRLWEAVWYLALFAFLYVWFAKIHALVVYDADDWTYLAYVRSAGPIWGDWNPAKVFPEVIMPFVSTVAVHFLMPLVGDYISTMTIAHAFVVSTFITGYLFCFGQLMKRTFSLSRLSAGLVTALFLTFHFLVFRNEQANNLYMFYCVDLNCYYNYLLPDLLNAALVMHITGNRKFDSFMASASPGRKGLFFVLLYLTIFSNLASSGILAAFAGSCLLLALLRNLKKFRLLPFVKDNALHLGILAAWLVSAIFELSGGRAAATSSSSLLKRVMNAFYLLRDVLYCCNRTFWICVAVICVIAVILFLRAKGKGQEEAAFSRPFLAYLVAGAALTVYMMVLCAMVWYGYVYRAEYLFPLFFYGFLLVMLALGYILSKKPRLLVVLPLALLLLVSQINTYGKTFRESTTFQLDPAVCADISRDILNQYLAADAEGLTEMTLYIPMYVADPQTQDNWPYSVVLLDRISRTLHEHGMISRHIAITPVGSPEFNERYHLPLPAAEE